MSFRLLGHDIPTGCYPAPAVPVLQDGDAVFVAYRKSLEPIAKNVQYVAESGHRWFDPQTQALFAFSERDVVAYRTSEETTFFESLLQDKRFASADPCFRLSFALETGREDLIGPELIVAFRAIPSEWRTSWFRKMLDELESAGLKRKEWENVEPVLTRKTIPRSFRLVIAPMNRIRERFRPIAERLRDLLDFALPTHGLHVVIAGSASHELHEQLSAIEGIEVAKDIWGVHGDVIVTDEPRNLPRDTVFVTYTTGTAAGVRIKPSYDRTWLGRLASGALDLEERIAQIALERVLAPALRDSTSRALELAWSHLKTLEVRELDRLRIEEQERALHRDLTYAWRHELDAQLRRTKDRVARTIESWHLATAKNLEAQVNTLYGRCREVIDEDCGQFGDARYDRDRYPVVERMLPSWLPRDREERVRRIYLRPRFDDRDVSFSLLQLADRFSRSFLAPLRSKQFESEIKAALLFGSGANPGLLRAIDRWADLVAIPELDRAVADAIGAESSYSYRRRQDRDPDPDRIPRIRALIDELTELRRDLQNI